MTPDELAEYLAVLPANVTSFEINAVEHTAKLTFGPPPPRVVSVGGIVVPEQPTDLELNPPDPVDPMAEKLEALFPGISDLVAQKGPMP